MQKILAIALQSMHNDMARVDHVAMNMANMTTPGYRSRLVSAPSFSSYFSAGNVAGKNSSPVGEAAGNNLKISTDTRPGTLKSTGQNLDLALVTEGYFEVATDTGPAYTRQGNFRVDGKGRLVTAEGFPVIGKGGEIYLSTSQPTIDAAGNVIENGRTVGQLKVVRFDHPKDLQRTGNGMVAAGSGMTVLSDAQTQIRQGFLENSNVSSMREMVQLMQTLRHFETMQRVTQSHDAMLGTALQKLSDM